MSQIVIGTRDSQLALTQTRQVMNKLQAAAPHLSFSIKTIKTKGDIILDTALAKIGDKGLFVKEIENALLQGEIDLAVHSMKDVPTRIPPGLTMAAVTRREDPRDAVVGAGNIKLAEMPAGAIIGTGSLRRIAQLTRAYPHLTFKPVRGNLNTRLKKLYDGEYSALILACAGLIRLQLTSHISEILSPELCLPAVGQGALGVECREDDSLVKPLLTAALEHSPTRAAVTAERAFLCRLEGGCQVPLGAYGKVFEDGKLLLRGVIASLDGQEAMQGQEQGTVAESETMGIRLAESLLARGGDAILEKVRLEFHAEA